MRSFLAVLALAACAAGCQSALPFESAEERRVKSLEDALENDTVQFELERESALADPGVQALWVPFVFDRTLALGEVALRESVGDAIPGAERAREAWLRCRGEILRSGPVAAAYCVQQLQTPGPRAGLARELLTELKPEDSREPIASALTSPLPAVRRAGIRAAVWTGQLLAFERQVAGLAGDPAWIVRREAALALGDSHSAEARAALFRALDDHQLLVAREAAVALGKRRVRECGDALLRFLERARAANDPTAIDAALTAFHALSGRKDLGADLTAWRQWVVENRPIVDTRPSAVN